MPTGLAEEACEASSTVADKAIRNVDAIPAILTRTARACVVCKRAIILYYANIIMHPFYQIRKTCFTFKY